MFKNGYKVIYYKDKYPSKLILYKLYNINDIDYSGKFLSITDNDGYPGFYNYDCFILLKDYRKIKLDKICSKLGI